ncbi:hypothetical protein TcCL_NonESM00023 [Trypanosoma cruzi]|uniref:Uncharacterized protein n=1 Tax=Trypanosoma cruzi (strain CL Brener) TaxID=353153 RepID=Q4DWX3_TRYCC|nr:hypothetical protein Tc00.1047053510729.115 [Trypanosoma cruzi]EAN97036.1 hypothetical protein Tc00.1047053510729.115 [Trypanosoma cruzi]RNC49705.1 hypothetical protein TcCL_NonESM00023 [Trypanosoma cruzi]|eukprot:XP_818887.1 hypothetical protein [Trypanosoma cruzi strain CL Brener]
MPLSIPKAIETVRRYVADQRDDATGSVGNTTCLHSSAVEVCEDPQRRILPAFRETWRGGPNIIASNDGSYFVAADCLWHDRNRILAEEIKDYASLKETPWAGGKLASTLSSCARCKIDATSAIFSNWPREQVTENLVKQSILDRAKLYRSCRINYIHGALGLQESPYGHAGEVYGDIHQKLSRARARAICPVKRQAKHTGDSLFGSIPLRQTLCVRRKGGVEPKDHLFGSLHVEEKKYL